MRSMFIPSNYTFRIGEHNGKSVIWIEFPYNAALVKSLKENLTTAKSWYGLENTQHRM